MTIKNSEINQYTLDFFDPEKQELLKKHLSYVLQANQRINLTRISSFSEGLLLHIEDSLVAYPEIQQALGGKYGDLGSGAGFPGIPLSITSSRDTVLVDSVQKKAAVLREITKELGLESQIAVYSGRIEELAENEAASFSVLTARALSSLPSLLELASPLLINGGQLICYKAQISEEEVNKGLSLEQKLAMTLISDRKVLLSDEVTARRVLVFEKRGEPTISLPRRVGMAQKKPLD